MSFATVNIGNTVTTQTISRSVVERRRTPRNVRINGANRDYLHAVKVAERAERMYRANPLAILRRKAIRNSEVVRRAYERAGFFLANA